MMDTFVKEDDKIFYVLVGLEILTKYIINHTHDVLGHMGTSRTY